MDEQTRVTGPEQPRPRAPAAGASEVSWSAPVHLLPPDLLEAANGFMVTDVQGIIHRVDMTAAYLLGRAPAMLDGRPLAFCLGERDRRDFFDHLSKLGRGRTSAFRLRVRLANGATAVRELLLAAVAIHDGDGGPPAIRWLVRDVTRRRETLRALRAARSFNAELLDLAETIVLVLDGRWCILRANAFASAATGRAAASIRRQSWREIFVPDEEEAEAQRLTQEAMLGQTVRSRPMRLRTTGTSERVLIWSAKPWSKLARRGGFILVGHDVTDQVHAQQAALQGERLATIGRTVTGLAHEGRNALQRIQAGVTVLSDRLADDPWVMERLNNIQRAQDDLHRLFEDVRQYAAPIQLELDRCDIGTLVQETWKELPSSAALTTEFENGSVQCIGDRYRLRQLFRNLLENAVAAVPPHGRIFVRCGTAEFNDTPAAKVLIQDNGPGFQPEQLQKAFEPFYTTKTRGTGLGLAICRRIVEAHGGRIMLSNSAAGGAEVQIVLPKRPQPASGSPMAETRLHTATGSDTPFTSRRP